MDKRERFLQDARVAPPLNDPQEQVEIKTVARAIVKHLLEGVDVFRIEGTKIAAARQAKAFADARQIRE
jgi:hypothetical protein